MDGCWDFLTSFMLWVLRRNLWTKYDRKLEVIKAMLMGPWATWSSGRHLCQWQQGLNLDDLEGSFQTKLFCHSMFLCSHREFVVKHNLLILRYMYIYILKNRSCIHWLFLYSVLSNFHFQYSFLTEFHPLLWLQSQLLTSFSLESICSLLLYSI